MPDKELKRVREEALLTDEEVLEVTFISITDCNSFREASLKLYRAALQAQLDKALNHKLVRIEADDQSLPENPNPITIRHNDSRYLDGFVRRAYNLAQQEMLTPDSEGKVWVKVEKRGEK